MTVIFHRLPTAHFCPMNFKNIVSPKFFTMKKSMKSVFATLFFAAFAQILVAQVQLGIGLRGGTNLAWSDIQTKNGSWETEHMDIIPRITIGALAEIGIGSYFAVQPEVNFIQKGYKTEIDVVGVTETYKVLMNYVEVPVLAKGKLPVGGAEINAVAGPTFGFAFDGMSKSGDEETDIDFDRDKIKKSDVGATFGIGAAYRGFFLDGRFGLGFTNLDDSENSDNHKWLNRGVNIGAGYIFRF